MNRFILPADYTSLLVLQNYMCSKAIQFLPKKKSVFSITQCLLQEYRKDLCSLLCVHSNYFYVKILHHNLHT